MVPVAKVFIFSLLPKFPIHYDRLFKKEFHKNSILKHLPYKTKFYDSSSQKKRKTKPSKQVGRTPFCREVQPGKETDNLKER